MLPDNIMLFDDNIMFTKLFIYVKLNFSYKKILYFDKITLLT